MKVFSETRNGELWVKPVGALDAAGARVLREHADELEHAPQSDIAVDLSDVPFVDSSGLGVLIALAKRAMRGTGRLRLVGAGEQPRRLVQLTQLDRFFHLEPDAPRTSPPPST